MAPGPPSGVRTLEVRRHAYTKKGEARGRGSHLSAVGVAEARAVGADMGPFHAVFVSDVPRTLETAIAMGFAVDDVLEIGWDETIHDELPHHVWWSWDEPFVRFADLVARGGAVAKMAHGVADTWRRVIDGTPEASASLVISHGSVIESALVVLFPDADHASWGAPLAHLDGVRITADGERLSGPAFVRVT